MLGWMEGSIVPYSLPCHYRDVTMAISRGLVRRLSLGQFRANSLVVTPKEAIALLSRSMMKKSWGDEELLNSIVSKLC